jgi:RNA polymerase sigma-70 factor (ECF subfamily)
MDDDSHRPPLRLVPGGAEAGSGHPERRAAQRPGVEGREEEGLVAAFLVGDDDAFGELVRRHQQMVLSIVRRYATSPDDAKDLAQRTFLRAFEAARRSIRKGPRAAVPFRRWLVRVAVNLAKNHRRDALRIVRAPLEDADGAASAGYAHGGGAPDARDALLRHEAERRMRAAVLDLPRRQREVLTLRIDAELPFAEIAEALGITENAAKVSFHHATRALRAALTAEDRP